MAPLANADTALVCSATAWRMRISPGRNSPDSPSISFEKNGIVTASTSGGRLTSSSRVSPASATASLSLAGG